MTTIRTDLNDLEWQAKTERENAALKKLQRMEKIVIAFFFTTLITHVIAFLTFPPKLRTVYFCTILLIFIGIGIHQLKQILRRPQN